MIYLTNFGDKLLKFIVPENIQEIDNKTLKTIIEKEEKYDKKMNFLNRTDSIYYVFRIPTRN